VRAIPPLDYRLMLAAYFPCPSIFQLLDLSVVLNCLKVCNMHLTVVAAIVTAP